YTPSYRTDEKGQKLVTDMQHYIIDLDLKSIANPEKLAQKLDQTVGVVEHGLFNNMVKKVIVAGQSGIQILEK
ncbi:MAG: ribose-5-phosphate isomerase A, partial [Streptococcaceae bacterium]|nr:ribose-5-phosphate isomerase A [Streptococcaceae bacterium]